MVRVVAAVRAVVTVVAVLIGVPILLVAVGGSAAPQRLSVARVQVWLDDPLRPEYVPATARAVAWLLWALLAALILTVWVLHVRRWRWERLTVYLPGPVQGLAATLLGAATVTTSVAVPAAHAAPAVTTGDTTAGDMVETQTAAVRPSATVDRPDPQAGAGHRAHHPTNAAATVTIRRGDTLEAVAGDRPGDPHRWNQIYRLNLSSSPRIHGDAHIEPGRALTLPQAGVPVHRPPRPSESATQSTAATGPARTSSAAAFEVGAGNTSARVPVVDAAALAPPAAPTTARPTGPTSSTATPDSEAIVSPAVRGIPATTPTAAPPNHQAAPGRPGVSAEDAAHSTTTWTRDTPDGSCRVVRGDTLWDLADQHLGDPHRWKEIYQLNRGHRQTNGYALTDPDEIDVGWILALPARHPGIQLSEPPITAPPGTEEPSPPATQPSSPPATPRSQSATPTMSASPTASTSSQNNSGDGIDAPPSQPGRATASAQISPHGAAGPSAPVSGSVPHANTDRGGEEPSASPLDGIDLPGGWITLGLGAGLVSAVAMVWRRRRHHYQPTPITRPHLDDPDLLPPLAAMTRIRTSLRRTAPEALDEQPAAAPTVREYQSAAVKPELPPIGPTGSDLAGAAELPLSTGLGLTGSGAFDAARGLLVATLAAGSDDDPDAKGHAIIPASTLATLLGVSAVDLGHLDRLTVTNTEADAITALEEEIIRRSRLIADAQVADLGTLRDTDVHAEAMPQLLLIAELLDPAWTNRLVTAVRLGHSVDIGAAIIGDWPTGTTLSVAADGTTGTDTRLGVLDTTTAIDALGLLREAHGDSDGPVRTQQPPPRTAHTAPEPAQDPDHPSESGSEPAGHTAPPADTPTPAPDPDDGRRPVVVRVLGRPAVLDADGQPSPGIRSKAVELLVYLAVNRNGADLSDIMEALFPDANLRRASERLSTVAADLRKHIRRAAATPTDTTETLRKRLEPIPNTGSRYHIDPTVVAVDWWTVLDHYEAVAATTDTSQQLAHLTAAIDAASGGLAQGAEYDWIGTDREAVRRHRIKLHVHTAALLADTDPHRSWLLLEQACEIDPLSDELARATMRAAATLSDADAIRHRLKTLREALDAHGLDITDDTETLARDLLRQLHPPRTSE